MKKTGLGLGEELPSVNKWITSTWMGLVLPRERMLCSSTHCEQGPQSAFNRCSIG